MTIDLIKLSDEVIAHTYNRFPIMLVKGQGSKVWDTEGKEYIDFVAGIAVCSLGHCHSELIGALNEQASTLWHVSNLYYTLPQTKLAEFLTKHSFADKAFFCNSGAEANEAAIKVARRYFSEVKKQPEKYRIISMNQSFHGRTMATLSATGQLKVKVGFNPVLDGFDFVPFNDLAAFEAAITNETCAVIMEPVQGEGGIMPADKQYLKNVRKICDEKGILLLFDEVQCGMGRVGTLFAYEALGVEPDVMSLAKAVANGMPMGVMLAREWVMEAFSPGAHATTFGGTPLVSAVALKTCELMVEKYVEQGRLTGEYFMDKLKELKDEFPAIVTDVRGIGLMLGLQLSMEGAEIVTKCMQKGFLINCTQNTILRFVPPLMIEKAEIDALVSCLRKIFKEMTGCNIF